MIVAQYIALWLKKRNSKQAQAWTMFVSGLACACMWSCDVLACPCLSVYIYIYIYVYPFVCRSICCFACLHACLPVCLLAMTYWQFLCHFLSTCIIQESYRVAQVINISAKTWSSISIIQSVCRICMSACLPACLSFSLSIYLYLSICLSVHLSVSMCLYLRSADHRSSTDHSTCPIHIVNMCDSLYVYVWSCSVGSCCLFPNLAQIVLKHFVNLCRVWLV